MKVIGEVNGQQEKAQPELELGPGAVRGNRERYIRPSSCPISPRPEVACRHDKSSARTPFARTGLARSLDRNS